MIKIPSKIKYLSYAGIIPVLIGVIGSLELNFISNNINNLLVEFGLFFSAIILSFLGGGLFILETHYKSEINFKGLFISMCPSIWAVFSLLLPMSCFLLAIGYLATLERERSLSKARTISFPNWWFKLRFQLTTLMILLLIILGFNV
tara:strand:+ start:587 stop:1027 length:441 start_codon:yes stop_codon:yes gene_type:complete